ncbi:C2H2 transcription factor [Zalerion maritima]|uniref:C2H2 transcription factor n=1 Tax=Zalerion maritima TaxID=339359 RepID=A0AAD5WNU8_9PEZI|nr:C2H2 transcription factor [Zalerion maritima]
MPMIVSFVILQNPSPTSTFQDFRHFELAHFEPLERILVRIDGAPHGPFSWISPWICCADASAWSVQAKLLEIEAIDELICGVGTKLFQLKPWLLFSTTRWLFSVIVTELVDYSYTSGTMFSTGYYSQTAPSADLFQGPSWDSTTVEGAQNFLDFSENGDAEEYSLYGHVTPRAHSQEYDVKRDGQSSVAGGEAMRRQTSTASHKNRTIKASSKVRHRVPSTLQTAQMPYEVTGNSQAFQDGPHSSMDMPISFQDPESQMFYQTPLSLGMSEVPTIGLVNPAQMQLDHQFDALLVGSPSEATLDSVSSNGNSPRTVSDAADDIWTVAASSPPESHSSSPEIQGQSRMNHKLGTVSMMSTDDLQGSVMTTVPDDFALPPAFGSRRPSSDGETARDHPLYKKAYPNQADGLYHCPWEGSSGCTHKPEKLKCNYDKFVDSHLKPYRCKVDSCENARFSSTACLLRHEREAHAMHGHGDKPYLCTYEGCDRAVPGNGFPRQWNLKDHMRRVHNDNGSTSARSTASAPPSSSKSSSKGRKRKQDTDSSTRKASLKASSASERRSLAASLAAKQPLIQEWYDHHMALQEMVNGMTKPDAMETLTAIKHIQDHVNQLSSLSHNLIYNQNSRR